MKRINSSTIVLLLSAAVLGGTARPAQAGTDVSIRFDTGRHSHGRHGHGHGRYYGGYPYVSAYRHNHGRHSHYYPYRSFAPVVVTQPVYVAPPAYPVSISGNYGQDIADFRERLNRLRGVVQKQKEKGTLTQDVHDRFMSALDGIERDQQARSYNRGGTLHAEDFAELYRRLDQTDEDIERALAG